MLCDEGDKKNSFYFPVVQYTTKMFGAAKQTRSIHNLYFFRTELNYCENNPDTCKNGGKCQSLESGDGHYRCQCPRGISGRNCENVPMEMTTAGATTSNASTEVVDTSSQIVSEEVTSAEANSSSTTKEPDNVDNETE